MLFLQEQAGWGGGVEAAAPPTALGSAQLPVLSGPGKSSVPCHHSRAISGPCGGCSQLSLCGLCYYYLHVSAEETKTWAVPTSGKVRI